MKKTLLLAAMFAAFSGSSFAQAQTLKGGTCLAFSPNGPYEDRIFTCNATGGDNLGYVTVKQLYEKGYRVVSAVQQRSNSAVLIFIEEQRPR